MLLFGGGSARAELIRLDAASTKFPDQVSGFSVVFDDGPTGTGDGLFRLDELVSFTVLPQTSQSFFGGPNFTFYGAITRVPDITGITVTSGACGAPDSEWCFSGGQVYGRDSYSYTLTRLGPTAVPEPGTGLLVACAMGMLGWASRGRARRPARNPSAVVVKPA